MAQYFELKIKINTPILSTYIHLTNTYMYLHIYIYPHIYTNIKAEGFLVTSLSILHLQNNSFHNKYIQKLYADISMPGYITEKLQKSQHYISKRPQHSPYPSAPNKYVTVAQEPIKPYESKPAGPKGINHNQKIGLSILYYARSVDPIIIMALSTLESEQYKATTQTIKNLYQLLIYLGTHPDTTI